MKGRGWVVNIFAMRSKALLKASICSALVMLALVKKKAATRAFNRALCSSGFRLMARSLLTMIQLFEPHAAIQSGSGVVGSKWSS